MREEDLHGLEVRAVELATTLHKTIQEGLADHEARLQDLEEDTDYSADLKKRISKLEVQMEAGIKLWKQLDLDVARLNRLLFVIHHADK
jgi:hypothetical protein